MTIQEKLAQWLCSFPGWGQEILTLEQMELTPGSRGLFTMGCRELSRSRNILGALRLRQRWQFQLRLVSSAKEETARWLEELTQWIGKGENAPILGAEPEQERIWAEAGRFARVDAAGTGTYTLQLWADMTALYNEFERRA